MSNESKNKILFTSSLSTPNLKSKVSLPEIKEVKIKTDSKVLSHKLHKKKYQDRYIDAKNTFQKHFFGYKDHHNLYAD